VKSVYITRVGGPEVLEVRDLPDPEPGPSQVRVRVQAIGINFADILMRMGLYPGSPTPPFVPGYEVAGIVDSAGSEVRDLGPGSAVVVPTNFGGYSDTLVAEASEVFPIPPGKSAPAGAALTVNYLTAYQALVHQGNLQKGQSVLIHGAAGGVGIAAIQIARLLEARIYGTASSSKHDYLRKQGVDVCIDYRRENFAGRVRERTGGRGVHLILDPIGGDNFRRSYKSLAPGGKLVMYGFSAASGGRTRSWPRLAWHFLRTPGFSAMDLMTSNKGVIGIHLGRMTQEKELLRSHMTQLVRWWAEGRIAPVVGASFPMALAAQAHEYIQDRKNIGKVVLTPN